MALGSSTLLRCIANTESKSSCQTQSTDICQSGGPSARHIFTLHLDFPLFFISSVGFLCVATSSLNKNLIDFGTSLDPDANLMTQANRFKTASWDKPFRNKTLGQTVSRHSPKTNRFKIAAWNETFQNIALGQTVSKQRCRTNRNSTVGQTVSTQGPKTNRFETASHA